jgi:hypothetical protein
LNKPRDVSQEQEALRKGLGGGVFAKVDKIWFLSCLFATNRNKVVFYYDNKSNVLKDFTISKQHRLSFRVVVRTCMLVSRCIWFRFTTISLLRKGLCRHPSVEPSENFGIQPSLHSFDQYEIN